MSKPPACPVSQDKCHFKFNTPTSKFIIFPSRLAPSPDGPGCATTDPSPPGVRVTRQRVRPSRRHAVTATPSPPARAALVLHFALLHLTDTAFLTKEGEALRQQKGYGALYCDTRLTEVVWSQSCSISELGCAPCPPARPGQLHVALPTSPTSGDHCQHALPKTLSPIVKLSC